MSDQVADERSALFRELFGAATGRIKNRMLKALIEAYPQPLTADEIATVIYPTHPPADPVQSIRVLVSGIRHSLAPLGWTVSTNLYGRAFPVGEYPTPRYALVRLS